jgi:hypothetical protein
LKVLSWEPIIPEPRVIAPARITGSHCASIIQTSNKYTFTAPVIVGKRIWQIILYSLVMLEFNSIIQINYSLISEYINVIVMKRI